MNDVNEDFTGVFYFTNPTKVDRKRLWNNKEYVFPAESTVPLIIPSETLENIQEIRKRFAKDMALERVYGGEKVLDRNGSVIFDYMKAKEMGGGLPPTFSEKILEPFIEECLKPMAVKRAKIQEAPKLDDERNYKATKAMGEGGDPNQLFAEENRNVPTVGKMSEN